MKSLFDPERYRIFLLRCSQLRLAKSKKKNENDVSGLFAKAMSDIFCLLLRERTLDRLYAHIK